MVLKIALDLAAEDGFELFQSFLSIILKDLSPKICIKAQPPDHSSLIFMHSLQSSRLTAYKNPTFCLKIHRNHCFNLLDSVVN